MKSLQWLVGCVVAATAAGCSCGVGPGGACGDDTDCQSGICLPNKTCAGNGTGGGSGNTGGGSGNTGGGASTGGGHSTGGGSGSTGGGSACTNLECQIPQCPSGGTTSISGKVYDPAGRVPLYNVTVYVPNKPLATLTAGPSCQSCAALITGAPVAVTLSGADGSFTLTGVPAGANIPLVVQVGKWRRMVTLPSVTACQSNPLTDPNLTRLPRNHTEGDLPQMAIASGRADPFECLLKKIGISDSEITTPNNGGRVHFYRENGMNLQGSNAPAGDTLYDNPTTLAGYDVVILPCEGGPNTKLPQSVTNLVNYTNAGGRVFTTHYGYVWTEPGWPQAAEWNPGLPDLYDTVFNVSVDQSFPKGMAFASWLQNVQASVSPGVLGVNESRHDVTAVKPGATRWLYGSIPASNPADSIQHLTFNTPFLQDAGAGIEGDPVQCGRVVYSDFHVTAGAVDAGFGPGGARFPTACVDGPLSGQEKALEFMLFDLSACVQNDNQVPTVCKAEGGACTKGSDCCAGLQCLDPSGNPCSGAGCACTAGIN